MFEVSSWFHRHVATNGLNGLFSKNMTSKSRKSSTKLNLIPKKSAKAKRSNVVMSVMVELGLKLMKYKSVAEVARFLTAAEVPAHVTKRVLLRPDLRRNLKRQHFA